LAPASYSPVGQAVFGGEVVAGHEGLAEEGVGDDLDGAVAGFEVGVAVGDWDGLSLSGGHFGGAAVAGKAVRPALD